MEMQLTFCPAVGPRRSAESLQVVEPARQPAGSLTDALAPWASGSVLPDSAPSELLSSESESGQAILQAGIAEEGRWVEMRGSETPWAGAGRSPKTRERSSTASGQNQVRPPEKPSGGNH